MAHKEHMGPGRYTTLVTQRILDAAGKVLVSFRVRKSRTRLLLLNIAVVPLFVIVGQMGGAVNG